MRRLAGFVARTLLAAVVAIVTMVAFMIHAERIETSDLSSAQVLDARPSSETTVALGIRAAAQPKAAAVKTTLASSPTSVPTGRASAGTGRTPPQKGVGRPAAKSHAKDVTTESSGTGDDVPGRTPILFEPGL